jgi:hypothetical protein
LFQIKTAITFAYGLKKRIIYEKLSTQKKTLQPFAQFLVSQNSKGKYESRKILDFVRKNEKKCFFFDFFIYFDVFLLLGHFEFFINFRIL